MRNLIEAEVKQHVSNVAENGFSILEGAIEPDFLSEIKV